MLIIDIFSEKWFYYIQRNGAAYSHNWTVKGEQRSKKKFAENKWRDDIVLLQYPVARMISSDGLHSYRMWLRMRCQRSTAAGLIETKCNGSTSADEITLLGCHIGIRVQRVERFVAFSTVHSSNRYYVRRVSRIYFQSVFPNGFCYTLGVNTA